MLYLKKHLSNVISNAATRAFPISDSAKVLAKSKHCDFTSDIANEIFQKYLKETTAFGLFNSREIADCIFVNIEKKEFLKQVQVSGLGELEVFVEEKYLKDKANELMRNSEISFERKGSVIEAQYVVEDSSGYVELGIDCARGFFIGDTMRNLQKLVGNRGVLYTVIHDCLPENASGGSKFFAYIHSKIQKKSAISQKDEKLLEMDAFLTKIGVDSRLIFTSDLYKTSEVRQDFEKNNEKINSVSQHWPWIKYVLLSLYPDSQSQTLHYFYKHHDLNLKKKLKSFQDFCKFSCHGEIFFPLSTEITKERLIDTLQHIENFYVPVVPVCYNLQGIALASLKYFVVKQPKGKTFHINIWDLLEKSSRSLWAVLAVYKYLRVFEGENDFAIGEVKGDVRNILLHVCKLPDVVDECIEETSGDILIDWLENLCELYIRADYSIPQESRKKVDKLLKIVIENTMKYIGIDLQKVYAKEK